MNLSKKIIIILNIALIALPFNLLHFLPVSAEETTGDSYEEGFVGVNTEEDNVGGIDVGINIETTNDNLPESLKSIRNLYSDNFSLEDDNTDDLLWNIENQSSEPKLIFNSSDLQDIRTLYCLGSVIPDYEKEQDALAAASGKTISEITEIKNNNPTEYQKLVTAAQESSRKKIVSNLKNDIPNFACIAGVSEAQAADMLKYDEDSVNAIIDTARNKIEIDRRILMLLVNLVTPKDQGGAGHELIKILRVRSGYNRDAKQNSQESTTIYSQIAEKNSSASSDSTISTVSDLKSASKEELSSDSLIAEATAQAEVLDSTGTSEGDLIFSDEESNTNLSAHYKGQAIDISAVDSIKCTLIKKKRIGSDSKKKLPATPISLAYQTTTGYDNSPTPDYSSLVANLQQISSTNYADLLDQLGITVDSDENLANATFSDIVGLIGKSLLGEILSSSSTSLSGSDFANTILKVGGIALADYLSLPREAFIDSDFNDLDELEVRIGQAKIEENLGLPSNSIEGNNLSEVFVNIGRRHLEKSLNLPEDTLTTEITDSNSLKLMIGRRVIEDSLYLTKSSFKSDTNYKKLQSIGGKRKIDLIYQNPASVDERLGIGLNDYSKNYKNGSLSPDDYAIVVANKLLSDSVYSFSSETSAANATRLSVDNTTNPTPTATADTRISEILSGVNIISNFQQIGVEITAQSFSKNSDNRAALIQWFNNKIFSDDCSIPSVAKVNIVTDNAGTLKTVSIPEDQFMSNFGLQRGDFFRIFGCSKSNPKSALKRLGENSLFNSIAKSSAVEKAKINYLSQHPELTSIIQQIDYYKNKLSTIKSKTNKIENDWSGVNDTNQDVADLKNGISNNKKIVDATDENNLSSGVQAVSVARSMAVNYDQIYTSLDKLKTSDNGKYKTKANDSLLDFSEINSKITEILTGQDQQDITGISLDQIGSIGASASGTDSGTQISKASLGLMLAGKLSPKNFLISFGGSKIDNSLDFPTNSTYYYSLYVMNRGEDSKVNGKDAFFQSIGQAQLEETLSLPAGFFQSDTPGQSATLANVRDHVAKTWKISEAEAGARIMKALDLSGDFNTLLKSTNFTPSSSIALSANNLDSKLSIPTGTTLNLIKGSPINYSLLSSTDSEMLSGKLSLSENLINIFSRVKTGEQSLSDGLSADYTSLIAYNSHNSYVEKTTNASNTNSCPVDFTYTKQDGVSFSISNQIQDESYVYTDSTGTHSFPSMDEARNYAEKNKDGKADFVKGIAIGLASNPKNPGVYDTVMAENYNGKLKDFLNDKNKKQALTDEEISAIGEKLEVSTSILDEMLKRKYTDEESVAKPINSYLQFIGKKTAERKVTTALVGSLGITVSGLQIDASDIFDLLSGNGLTVAEKIGSRYIGQQMDIDPNTISSVVQSPSTILRNCSLANLGANFVGGALGIGSLSLSGNLYENLGSAKIEKVLGLPTNSFKGATLDELINNIGAVSFARAFELPPDKILTSDVMSNLSVTSTAEGQSIDKQYSITENKLKYPKEGTSSSTVVSVNQKLKENLNSTIKNYADGNIGRKLESISISDYQNNNFLLQVDSIDSQLSITSGTTKKLITGEITPDNYRRIVAETVIGITPTGIDNWGKILGIDTEYINKINGFNNLRSQIVSCKNQSSVAGSSEKSCNYGEIFSNLSQVFGIDLDNKLDLPAGSLGRIIEDPAQAAATMVLSSLNKLDDSLGLDSGSAASFTAAYTGNSLPYSDLWKTGAMQFRSNDSIVSQGSSASDRWEYYGEKIGGQLLGNYLNKIGVISAPSPTSGFYLGKESTSDLILSSTEMLVHGDLRILEVTAAIKSLEALHVYEDSSSPNLPSYYRISFEDVYHAIVGDSIIEEEYSEIATNNFFTNYQASKTNSAVTEETEMAGTVTEALYGSQCPPGVKNENCLFDSSSTYSTYKNYDSMVGNYNQLYPGSTPDATLVDEIVNKYPTVTESLERTQEGARNQANKALRNNLLWRMADAKLYQADKNIPAGFAKTMYSGTGTQRTAILLDYVKNALSNLSFNGINFDKVELGIEIYNQITSYFQNPSGFDLDALVNSGKMDGLDNWASKKLEKILGFNLQPGTFTSLLYGLKTGNFTSDITIAGSGTQIKSLTNIYKDWATAKITGWADKALGLPSGSVFTAYTMYRDYQAAKDALTLAEKSGVATDISSAKAGLSDIQNAGIAYVVNLVFSKQIAEFESAVGLVPGTGSMLVSMLITGFNPISVAIFLVMNLFGVYKTVVTCTADGYYPSAEPKSDPAVVDNGELGTFNGLKAKEKKAGFVEAAQYKARTLIGDVLFLSERTSDELAIPSQIMTGRQEDVDYWQYKVEQVICSKVGGCEGSRAGLWANPQTTGYVHIGF